MNTKPTTTTAVIYESTRETLKELTDRGFKVPAAFAVWERGWKLLTDEQKNQALNPPAQEEPDSALADDSATDPLRESTRLTCRASRLADKMAKALGNDGEIDRGELGELLQEIRTLRHQGERVAHATRKTAAKRKGACGVKSIPLT